MRMNRLAIACLASCAALAASCAPRPQPPQPVAPPPAPAPTPPPVTPPPQPPADWRDAPLTPGDWNYSSGGSAVFASAGVPALTVRCDSAGRLSIVRTGAGAGGRITIRTSFGDRTLTALPSGAGLTATIPAADPLLDQIVHSRGRFLVQADGAPALIVPAWPEPARVVEDCRA
jgi:hypothetical protein